MVSILFDLLTSKKIAPSLIRVEKSVFEIRRKGYQKNRNFAIQAQGIAANLRDTRTHLTVKN
jgi:hypothetical protein